MLIAPCKNIAFRVLGYFQYREGHFLLTHNNFCDIIIYLNFRNTEMNERIYELAVQAKIQMVSEPRLQEFAELIVKECVEQSMSIGRYNTPSGITPDLSIAIAVGLKKHFGVEE
jgi:hypothetical protein